MTTRATHQFPLPMTEEQVDLIWDCDWEEQDCPVCGHPLDKHNSRDMARCANAA